MYPFSFLFINIYILAALSWFLIKKKYATTGRKVNGLILLATCFIVANGCFCILSTVVVFRYQFFPMIVSVSFALLLVTWLESATSPADIHLTSAQGIGRQKKLQALS
jgi:hypothetical protein